MIALETALALLIVAAGMGSFLTWWLMESRKS